MWWNMKAIKEFLQVLSHGSFRLMLFIYFFALQFLMANPISDASIGIKRMGELEHSLIVSAAKKKYPEAEVEEKAVDFACQVDDKLRNAVWNPFKVVVVGADHKVSINYFDKIT